MYRELFFLVIITVGFRFILRFLIISDDLIVDYYYTQYSYERIKELLEFRSNWYWVSIVVTSIFILVKVHLISVWILTGTVFFGLKVRFKQIFKAVIIAEYVWLVPVIIKIIWFGLIRSDYSLSDIFDLKPISLMIFLNEENVNQWLLFPIRAMNILQLTYIAVLSFVMAKVIDTTVTDSFQFTVPVYGMGFIIWVVFITFLSMNIS